MKRLYILLIFLSYNLKAQKPPNIIIFMVDDMGWQDCSLPFYSEKTKWNSIYKTPNMERMAAKGTKFTHAYSASVCSPSRVSLMTGMSPLNHHVTNWTLLKNADNDRQSSTIKPPKININGISSLPNIENTVHATTLPMVLQQNGYHTIHVGKAHLGAIGTPGSDPLNLGFDVNIAGHAAGAPHSYLGSDDYGNKDKKNIIWAVPGLEKYWGTDTFLTEALTLEAIDALKKAKETKKPFFLHMSHYAIHSPYKIDTRYVPKYLAAGLHPTEAMYAALVEGMDKSLGDIMDYLEATDEEKNTMILFLSDNGGQSADLRAGEKNTHNSPLRSGKGSAYEGGIRIPMIMKWPNKIKENAVNNENVIIEDVFPTILAVAGIAKPKTLQAIDGKNILKANLNNAKREFFWHFPHLWGPPHPYDQPGPLVELHSVIRKGDMKLIYLHGSQTFEMYNTKNDISETTNILFENKKLAQKMAKSLGKKLKQSGSKMPSLIKENKSIPYPDERIKVFL